MDTTPEFPDFVVPVDNRIDPELPNDPEFDVCNKIEPVDELPDVPDFNVIIPEVAICDDPDCRNNSPPLPDEDEPIVMKIDPLLPLLNAFPVPRYKLPLLPIEALPLDSTIAPELPKLPALLVLIKIEPVDEVDDEPLCRVTLPEIVEDVEPDIKINSPPLPDTEDPT